MSIVLSIYSQEGFREVTLPERGQSELQILIQRELFVLDRDICLNLERQQDTWFLDTADCFLLLSDGGKSHAIAISADMNLKLETPGGYSITIISFEQSNPFSVYRKFSLAQLQLLQIGRNEGNDIRYQSGFVSGTHCTISIRNGKAILTDKSTNGTYLNLRRVHGSAELHYGDSIRIMRLNLIYLGNMLAIDECEGLTIAMNALEGDGIARHAGSTVEGGSDKTLFHRSPRKNRLLPEC